MPRKRFSYQNGLSWIQVVMEFVHASAHAVLVTIQIGSPQADNLKSPELRAPGTDSDSGKTSMIEG